MPFDPFPLKGDVFFIPNSRLNTLLSTKSGLGNATNIFRISVTRPVHSNTWNRRKPFLKSIPKMAIIYIPTPPLNFSLNLVDLVILAFLDGDYFYKLLKTHVFF